MSTQTCSIPLSEHDLSSKLASISSKKTNLFEYLSFCGSTKAKQSFAEVTKRKAKAKAANL